MNITPDLAAYLAEIMPDARQQCAGCVVERPPARMIEREGNLYCCEQCAEMKLAKMVRPQPKSTKYEGWDI